MKTYSQPKLDMLVFQDADIITTSNTGEDWDNLGLYDGEDYL